MKRSSTISQRLIVAVLLASLVSLFLAISGCAPVSTYSQDDQGTEYAPDDFHFLSNYGEWLSDDALGDVWRPYTPPEWAPFSYGHWVMSDYGWTWLSYEPYGWLVYHHGNWLYQQDLGWVWLPGNVWSPATVQWLNYGDNVGWAPQPPSGYFLPEEWQVNNSHVWNVVNMQDFEQEDIWRHRVDRVDPNEFSSAFHTIPDIKTFELLGQHTITPEEVKTKSVRMGHRSVDRMVLTDPETKRYDKFKPVVVKEALHPLDTNPKKGKAIGTPEKVGVKETPGDSTKTKTKDFEKKPKGPAEPKKKSETKEEGKPKD